MSIEPSSEARVEHLVRQLSGGDRNALAELFSCYQPALLRMVQFRLDGRLAGRIEPADVLQEGYIDAEKRIQHYLDKPEMPFFLWLRLVVSQTLVTFHRRHLGAQMRSAQLEHSIDHHRTLTASSVCIAAQLVGKISSPSHAAMRSELAAQIETCLETLDPVDREVLALRHFEELSNNEVAAILGIDKHAASKRYVRALGRMKTALSRVPGLIDEN